MYSCKLKKHLWLPLLFVCLSLHVHAQTDIDADMMAKGLLCTGPMYSYSSWNHYWEGTRKRDNRNLGTITTHMFSIMGNYGISKKLNILFNIPYVKTNASAGTLHPMKGLQDASLFLKWRPFRTTMGNGTFSLLGVGGYRTPLSDYTPDFLPLSIGLHNRSLLGRVIADYQWKKLFVTASGTYINRSNIELHRNAYYTTEMHYTNKVDMPDAASFNFRAGYRSKRLLAEAMMNNWTTLGGFDISRNNMPFPSNRMNTTMAELNVRWIPKPVPSLTLNAGADYTLAGRNAGQTSTVYGGVYYIFNFNRKKTTYQFQTN